MGGLKAISYENIYGVVSMVLDCMSMSSLSGYYHLPFICLRLISLGFLVMLSLVVLKKVWKRHNEERFKDSTVLGMKDKETISGSFLLIDDISCLILFSKPFIYFFL